MTASRLTFQTLSQFTGGQEWQISLAHDRGAHLLIWTTRGQGRLLLRGTRRGVGTHNAIFVPAHTLFSFEPGSNTTAMVVTVPMETNIKLPQIPRQLRIRDKGAMTELTTLIEAATREQNSARPLSVQSLDAYGSLISVWLQRQCALEEHAPPRRNASAKLADAYCMSITRHFAEAMTMADHAEALGVTPTHLTRVCKAATGRTAADLLTERILYEARQLLTTTKVPAQDIARFLGFGSAAYFTRFIQQHCEATPTALRRAAQPQRQTPFAQTAA